MVDDDVINSKVGKPIRLDATFPVNKTFTDLACKNSLCYVRSLLASSLLCGATLLVRGGIQELKVLQNLEFFDENGDFHTFQKVTF